MIDQPIDWAAVRDFLCRCPVVATTITAGTSQWCLLPDDDPAKMAALVAAGSRWVLEAELDQIDRHRAALKDAAVDLSTALPWAAIARRLRDRDAWYRDHPELRRKKSS